MSVENNEKEEKVVDVIATQDAVIAELRAEVERLKKQIAPECAVTIAELKALATAALKDSALDRENYVKLWADHHKLLADAASLRAALEMSIGINSDMEKKRKEALYSPNPGAQWTELLEAAREVEACPVPSDEQWKRFFNSVKTFEVPRDRSGKGGDKRE